MLLSLPLGRLVLYLLPAPVSSAMLSVVTSATSVLSSGAKYDSFGSRKRDWLGRNGETGIQAAEEGEEEHAERHQHVVRFRVLADSTMKTRGNANSVLPAWSNSRAVSTENTDLALLFYRLPRFHGVHVVQSGLDPVVHLLPVAPVPQDYLEESQRGAGDFFAFWNEQTLAVELHDGLEHFQVLRDGVAGHLGQQMVDEEL